MKLSICVCAYNAQDTLARCLDSLCKQKIEKEIIVVNDGSTDQTPLICEEYAKKYDFVHVLHQSNEGVASARNAALKAAQGDYITYVDSDDEAVDQAYEKVMKKAQEGYDIVVYDALRIGQNEAYMKCAKCAQGEMSMEDYFISEPCPWNKIVKKEVWQKSQLMFPKGIIYEDYAVIPNLGRYAQKIWYMEEAVVRYYLTEVSITRGSAYKAKAVDILRASEVLVQHCDLDQLHDACEWMLYDHLLQTSCRYFLSFEKYEECRACADLMNHYFKSFLKNKWVKQCSFKERAIAWLFARKMFKFVHFAIHVKR